jgi:hypothetical protein
MLVSRDDQNHFAMLLLRSNANFLTVWQNIGQKDEKKHPPDAGKVQDAYSCV